MARPPGTSASDMSPRARKRLAIALLVVGMLALVDLLVTVLSIMIASYEGTHGAHLPIEPFWPSPLWRACIGIGFVLLGTQSDEQMVKMAFGALYIAFGIPLLLLLLAFWIYPRKAGGVVLTQPGAPTS